MFKGPGRGCWRRRLCVLGGPVVVAQEIWGAVLVAGPDTESDREREERETEREVRRGQEPDQREGGKRWAVGAGRPVGGQVGRGGQRWAEKDRERQRAGSY